LRWPNPAGPLKGLRILDLTTVLLGPFGAQALGDWGTEVIKAESLTGDIWQNMQIGRRSFLD
jgi:crotonobetainyl-CoA:carnitine CoA-transferase CaiB-like acyl-CoA transferase